MFEQSAKMFLMVMHSQSIGLRQSPKKQTRGNMRHLSVFVAALTCLISFLSAERRP
jgi:hypothetical protein